MNECSSLSLLFQICFISERVFIVILGNIIFRIDWSDLLVGLVLRNITFDVLFGNLGFQPHWLDVNALIVFRIIHFVVEVRMISFFIKLAL